MISILRSHRSLCWQQAANPRETGHATYEHYEWPETTDRVKAMLTRIRMGSAAALPGKVGCWRNIRTLMTGYGPSR